MRILSISSFEEFTDGLHNYKDDVEVLYLEKYMCWLRQERKKRKTTISHHYMSWRMKMRATMVTAERGKEEKTRESNGNNKRSEERNFGVKKQYLNWNSIWRHAVTIYFRIEWFTMTFIEFFWKVKVYKIFFVRMWWKTKNVGWNNGTRWDSEHLSGFLSF